jgi:hypothetical protein
MRTLLACAVALLLAAPALAFDVTSCSQFVPPGEQGLLRVDLVCTEGQYAVYLGKKASLFMNGHSILGNGSQIDAVGCDGNCAVMGPGEIADFDEYAISANSGGKVTVSHLDIHDCESGVLADHIRATNVTASNNEKFGFGAAIEMQGSGVVANGNGISGFFGPRLRLVDSTMSVNGSHGLSAYTTFKGTNVIVRDNGGAGIVGGHVNGTNLTASGNQQGGVYGFGVRLRDSTSVGNMVVDIGSSKLPHLVRTACDTSLQWETPGQPTWGVCAQD